MSAQVGVIQMGTVDSGPGTTNELHGPGGGLASGLKECSMNPANATGSGFLGALVVKNQPANAQDIMICGFNPLVGKIPWRRA